MSAVDEDPWVPWQMRYPFGDRDLLTVAAIANGCTWSTRARKAFAETFHMSEGEVYRLLRTKRADEIRTRLDELSDYRHWEMWWQEYVRRLRGTG